MKTFASALMGFFLSLTSVAADYPTSYYFSDDGQAVIMHLWGGKPARDIREAKRFYRLMKKPAKRKVLSPGTFDVKSVDFVAGTSLSFTCFKPIRDTDLTHFCSLYMRNDPENAVRVDREKRTVRVRYVGETARALHREFRAGLFSRTFDWESNDDRTRIRSTSAEFELTIDAAGAPEHAFPAEFARRLEETRR